MNEREALAEKVGNMRRMAALFVKRHAAIYAPAVALAEVDSICIALGEISIDEACDVLDRLQSEAELRKAEPS